MNNPIFRSILAIIGGLVIAILVVALAEAVGHAIFPQPEGLDITKPEDQARLMEVIPTGAKVAVVVAWFLGSIAGAATAMAIARSVMPGWIVGLAMIALSVISTQMFPHPAWMMASAIALPLIGVVVAKRLVARRLAP